MARKITLGKQERIYKDRELFHTTDEDSSIRAVNVLLSHQIPFTRNVLTIPFFLRRRFHNSSEIYVVNIHRNYYKQARQLLDQQMPELHDTVVYRGRYSHN